MAAEIYRATRIYPFYLSLADQSPRIKVRAAGLLAQPLLTKRKGIFKEVVPLGSLQILMGPSDRLHACDSCDICLFWDLSLSVICAGESSNATAFNTRSQAGGVIHTFAVSNKVESSW